MDNDYKLNNLPLFLPEKTSAQKNKAANIELPKNLQNNTKSQSPEKSSPVNQQDEYIPSNQDETQSPLTYSLNDIKKTKITPINELETDAENNKVNKQNNTVDLTGTLNNLMQLSLKETDEDKSSIEKMIEDTIKLMAKSAIERSIIRALEANGIELKDGDILSMSINKNGEFSIDADKSTLGDKTGKSIELLCNEIEEILNTSEAEDGSSLGKWIISQVAEDLNIDLNKLSDDTDFTLTFSFEYNPETQKREIFYPSFAMKKITEKNNEKINKPE
ncbi:MAG: hypothetical protein LBP59_05870 [Planctomycetaceae bacterium]|jgi:hypothetical protein|nr:hypothetical protein [Planctomycetaceae bacterium]